MQYAVITFGIGHGNSIKSSFDEALRKAGISFFNHTLLSSTLPFDTVILKGLNLDEIIIKHGIFDVYGEILHSIMAVSVEKKKASSGLGFSFNPYCPFVIEAHGKEVKNVEKELKAGIQEMLEKRLMENPFFLSRDIAEKYKKESKIVICSGLSNKAKYTATVVSLTFIPKKSKLEKIVKKYVKDKKCDIYTKVVRAPAGI